MKAIIIGGGASGITCAVKIKQNRPDCDVVVLEHSDAPCKKIYATGNGRCNLTNINADGYNITKEFFDSLGLIMRRESGGRMYPYSNQAATVAELLLDACEKYKIPVICDCHIHKAEKIDNRYNVYTSKGIYCGEALVLATGGMSQKYLGSDGSGYIIAKDFSHTITDLSPALVQLKSSSKHCRALKGLRVKCNVKIEINGVDAAQEYGELLFCDYGISGIVVMNLSKYVNDERLKKEKDKCIAVIDFIPEMSEDEIINHYNKFGSLTGILSHKLCSILSKQAEGDPERIARYVKNWKIIITGTKGYDFAQITNGGVSTDEINENNESKICENLYIIGELADRQFCCGGFNLDNAFSSGIIAANDIARKKYD